MSQVEEGFVCTAQVREWLGHPGMQKRCLELCVCLLASCSQLGDVLFGLNNRDVRHLGGASAVVMEVLLTLQQGGHVPRGMQHMLLHCTI